MAEQEPHITQPVRVDEEALIHNVYKGSDGLADDQSQGEFSQYLVDRMYGADDPVARKYRPGAEIPNSRLTFDGWLVRPRTALLATLAATLAINIGVNGRSIAGRAGNVIDDVIHWVNPATKTVSPSVSHRETVTKEYSFPIDLRGPEQPSGVAKPNLLSARQLVKRIKAASNGGRVAKLVVEGEASDEWTADGIKSVGHPDGKNRNLAGQRAERFAGSVSKEAAKQGVELPGATIKSKEDVLHGRQLGRLLAEVQQSRYGSVLAAISAYNRGDKSMPSELHATIHRLIGAKRRGIATVDVEQSVNVPGKTVTLPVPGQEAPSKPEKNPITPIFIPIPPIPRVRRRYEDPFEVPPEIYEKPLDKVWIELYEEALPYYKAVVDNAWSLTRKYQALYREERITQGLRYEYEDAGGKAQSIDVLFTDRPELDQDVIEAVSRLMFDISLMQGGKVAEKLDTVVVLPSEHAGRQKPDKIGLGIDEQFHENVLGVAIPLLGLVELQLPQNPTAEDLDKFKGLRWTFAHEVAGHFTDVNDKARFIDKAKSNRKGRTFDARDPWTGAGDDGFATTGRRNAVCVLQFAIPNPGNEPGEYIVNPGSQELVDAPSARLRGQSPTNYGDESAAELHAETAAAVLTEIPIPAGEAGQPAAVLGNKPAGYSVDAGLQHRYVSHVGGQPNVEALAWPIDRLEEHARTFDFKVLAGTVELNGDADQHAMSEGAKNSPYQEDARRLKILTPATR